MGSASTQSLPTCPRAARSAGAGDSPRIVRHGGMSAPGKSPRSCEFASDTNTSPAAAKPPTVRKRTISGGLSDGSGTPNPFRVAQNVKRQSENFLKLRANIRKNQSTSVVGIASDRCWATECRVTTARRRRATRCDAPC